MGVERSALCVERSAPVLRAVNVRKTYPSGDRTLAVLQGADFSISAGETVSIRGESGSGKSTLLNIIGLLEAPTAGDVAIAGQIGRAHD